MIENQPIVRRMTAQMAATKLMSLNVRSLLGRSDGRSEDSIAETGMTCSCFSCAAGTANVNNICCNINSPATCYLYIPKRISISEKGKKKPLKKRKPSFTIPGRWRNNGETWRVRRWLLFCIQTHGAMKAEGWMWTRGRPTSCFRVFLTTHFVRQQFTYPIENILICGTNTQQQLWGENLWPQLDVWHIYCALATVYNIVNISNSIKLVLPIKKASPVATQVLHVWDYDSLFWLFYGEFYSFRKLIVIMRLENRKYREFPSNLSYFRISIMKSFLLHWEFDHTHKNLGNSKWIPQ